MKKSAIIEPGCTVLDRENNVWRVVSMNPPEIVETDLGPIEVLSCEVTNGEGTTTKLLGELDRANTVLTGNVLARGFR